MGNGVTGLCRALRYEITNKMDRICRSSAVIYTTVYGQEHRKPVTSPGGKQSYDR